LISAAELAGLRRAGEPMTILDVRWRLDKPDGLDDYRAGHVPGAVYVSLEHELSDHTIEGRGRHPLPSGPSVEAAARRWGVRQDVPVVVYDDWNRMGSARAWWVLTAAGLTNVRILDGGLGAWRASGGSLETGDVVVELGDVVVPQADLYAGALATVTAREAAAGGLTLLDARAPERFRGDVEPMDPVAGHVPGATNFPGTGVLAHDGTFLADEALVELFAERGVDREGQVAFYCGSGVSATVPLVALAALGGEPALFPGSWSEWVSDPDRPVARGEE
jgi:thiosulfate/3-mercaptopyruvate sulfurtransferase